MQLKFQKSFSNFLKLNLFFSLKKKEIMTLSGHRMPDIFQPEPRIPKGFGQNFVLIFTAGFCELNKINPGQLIFQKETWETIFSTLQTYLISNKFGCERQLVNHYFAVLLTKFDGREILIVYVELEKNCSGSKLVNMFRQYTFDVIPRNYLKEFIDSLTISNDFKLSEIPPHNLNSSFSTQSYLVNLNRSCSTETAPFFYGFSRYNNQLLNNVSSQNFVKQLQLQQYINKKLPDRWSDPNTLMDIENPSIVNEQLLTGSELNSLTENSGCLSHDLNNGSEAKHGFSINLVATLKSMSSIFNKKQPFNQECSLRLDTLLKHYLELDCLNFGPLVLLRNCGIIIFAYKTKVLKLNIIRWELLPNEQEHPLLELQSIVSILQSIGFSYNRKSQSFSGLRYAKIDKKRLLKISPPYNYRNLRKYINRTSMKQRIDLALQEKN